ncbi:MAG: anthranilate phosphoribosyltransferase [Lasallia pustulata]|uniref:Anthranilate phosphoribosyltransferase n=1 Tax=Lasallia pustulata TaxID=136370 RepID=A0A1W5CRD1_9LECA|nr:MAG: anthranilate phosphoribosyltransferase [Lasallia pustulata]SLM33295.1 anthranilate phosphoribosyltransferase [Lasallia pustulata]
MKHVAPIRTDLDYRTIFNILGPLANPVEGAIEARVVGVSHKDLGPVFAEALRLRGAKKTMVVCGAEDLDEISCAGKTYCWRLIERPNPAFCGPKNEEDEDYTTSDEEAPPRMLVKMEEFELDPSWLASTSAGRGGRWQATAPECRHLGRTTSESAAE